MRKRFTWLVVAVSGLWWLINFIGNLQTIKDGWTNRSLIMEWLIASSQLWPLAMFWGGIFALACIKFGSPRSWVAKFNQAKPPPQRPLEADLELEKGEKHSSGGKAIVASGGHDNYFGEVHLFGDYDTAIKLTDETRFRMDTLTHYGKQDFSRFLDGWIAPVRARLEETWRNLPEDERECHRKSYNELLEKTRSAKEEDRAELLKQLMMFH